MVTITAAELQRQFGRYVREAQREPVAVTHHGQASVVLVSAAEFERLKSLDDRQALRPWELPPDVVTALENVDLPPEGDAFDDEVR